MHAGSEPLTPLVRSGGVIPSVDHQTPSGVSLERYRTCLKLRHAYIRAWAR